MTPLMAPPVGMELSGDADDGARGGGDIRWT